MTTTRVGTIATLLAGLALSVSPVAAQDRHDSGDRRGGQTRGERRRPRDGNQGGDSRGNRADGNRADGNRAEGNRQGGGGGERREAVPRAEGRDRSDAPRYDNNRNDRGRYDRDDRGRYDRDDRGRDRGRPIVIVPQRRDNRYYARPYYSRPSSRVYVVPYGYRPHGYRPGWSLNLYFGRPYGSYGSGGYYNNGGYGYYALRPGYVYGSLRIVDAPRYAQVFVDGYYAGVVDDYDGVFQRLNLEPGAHQVEIEVYQGAPPLTYDVYVEPGRTMTIHVQP